MEENNLAKKIPITLTQKIVANQKLLPNKIQLRNATLDDTQEILNLMEQMGSLTNDPRFVVRIQTYVDKPNHHILVATKGKSVVGFIAFVIYDLFLSEGKRCRIEGMIVDAKQHDLSVKRKLMQAAEQFARENNGKVIDMIDGTCRKRDGSHDFYKFLGYNNEGSMSKIYLRKEL
jgi:ribosomal protein S18 acetylase RimI-like enzyme